jgi:outer membrane lipoprotein-sorting protein
MRRFLLTGIVILLLSALPTLDTVSALSVEEIAASFKKKYEKTNNFSADFEQTTFVAGQKRVAKGKLNFQKPNLLRQRYSNPTNPEDMVQLVVSDGKTLWSYTPLINQVTKQELAQDESSKELLPGFGQSLENVEKNYSLSLVEDKLAEKQGIHVVELVPKRNDESIDSMFDVLQLWIRDKDSIPVQFMYKDGKNQITLVLSFKNVKINENIDESTFKFEVPKGVQVITIPSQ